MSQKKQIKGYNYPPFEPKMVTENVFVGCRRCHATWYETRTFMDYGFRINGPMFDYDYCSECHKPNEDKHGKE